jgi:beta-N-acetylhexosaminidase
MRFTTVFLLLFSFFSTSLIAQFSEIAKSDEAQPYLKTYKTPPFLLDSSNTWVNRQLKSMSLNEKIGQLFMVAAYSNKGESHKNSIQKLVSKYGLGGLIFFQGGPVRQARLTNYYQRKAKVPLMIAMDAEWGLDMRLDSTIGYPRQMALGAIKNNEAIYEMGAALAEQCRRLGVHVNFAPVIDVNNNPKNPVINSRSFGENKVLVAEKGIAYMKGMQDNLVLACGKHFPGHGDTDADSHKSLPVISHDLKRLEELEMYPFRELIDAGLGSMMVAHLFVPALDNTPNVATTLSSKVVTDLLKNELQFKGLIFTDALNMKGVSSYFEPGEVDVRALLAGNDVLLFAEDVPKAISKIKAAILSGEISEGEISKRCAKILKAKYWLQLNKNEAVEMENLYEDLNSKAMQLSNRKVVEKSLTLIQNRNNLLPYQQLDSIKLATIAIGGMASLDDINTFQKTIDLFAPAKHFGISSTPSFDEIIALNNSLEGFNHIVISLHGLRQYPGRNFGITKEMANAVKLLEAKGKVALVYFGNPYGLKHLEQLDEIESILIAYHDGEFQQEYAAQALFGAIDVNGKLPVTISDIYPAGTGFSTEALGTFKYTQPEELNIASSDLNQIDSISLEGIKAGAYPGCQVLVAKEGKVIYKKNFGYYTYDNKKPVTDASIYDLASITKIASTTLSVMKLYDDNKFDLDKYLCDYLPDLVDSAAQPYGEIVLRDMLSHKAGLTPWIPFYKNTLANGYPKYNYYSLVQSETYPFRVAENLFMHKDYPNRILSELLCTPLLESKKYKYSDLGYYFLTEIIEKQSNLSQDQYVAENFYKPMGLATATYKPMNVHPKEIIVPTENDKTFRRQLVHGDVHDPGAAMMGGVAGHAGLFSNANDLAKIMQCFMNFGEYGGKRYISEETVKEFVRCQFCEEDNRRGAGFDKPVRNGEGGPTCNCISLESFGHTGFTGTMAWADPDEEIIYIFLSNRVYPDASNTKLLNMDIRTRIQEVIYDAVANSKVQQEG